VSSERRVAPPPASLPRLGHLLKQAHLRFTELASAALAPLGVGVREWAALLCLHDERELSQAEVARLLGIDRTTMVALVDELQTKGLVTREPRADDRRKNRVQLTAAGREILHEGEQLADEIERKFLAVLGEQGAVRLKRALQTVIGPRP
jgi:DNA-binding MarR family transcriptional regulator